MAQLLGSPGGASTARKGQEGSSAGANAAKEEEEQREQPRGLWGEEEGEEGVRGQEKGSLFDSSFDGDIQDPFPV